MRIAEICANPPEFVGGLERYCLEISKRLVEKGHEIEILTSEFGLKHVPDSENMKIRRFKCLGKMWGTNPLTFIGGVLLKEQYDLVHAHSYIFFTSNQAALFKKVKKYPFLLHLHGGVEVLPGTVSSFPIWFKREIYDRSLGKFTLYAADRIASVSKRDMALAALRFGIPEDKFEWIPNGVDTSQFRPLTAARRYVGFVGRLEKWKGILAFISIARAIHRQDKDIKFLVVGDGPLRMTAEALAKTLPFTFTGFVPHESMPRIYSTMTVLVSPSLCEGLPTTYMEAMACGVPVVATDVGGTTEIVRPGITGFIGTDTDSFSSAILKLTHDLGTLETMRYKAFQVVRESFDIKSVVERLFETVRAIGKKDCHAQHRC
ncbi:MAG: glycosyltransferase family 4 protein [Deltaproteobacteria bacterium]|nr:glycosyltransferase family 4 protein [Deltaproteobacteria bacterium]